MAIPRGAVGTFNVPLNEQASSCATFAFENEDHTLGNSLRYMIMKNPNTSFCGYSIPHPSEPYMNLRVQTNGRKTAAEVFEQGLQDLLAASEHVRTTFKDSVAEFKQKQGQQPTAMDED
eukprot:TRINITY_DN17715_c0_g1_i2.p1 TRINITY_DN17715_c0_g1~~TRINITY_DN17715_c0_g1_i2.p1  ORF type:complete len:119 (-),score=32.70 TRINITY_DN17715_c0_g1_i2:353-709(-)